MRSCDEDVVGTTPAPRRRARNRAAPMPEGAAWAGSGVSGVLSFDVPESVVLLSVPAGWVETDNDARTNGGLTV